MGRGFIQAGHAVHDSRFDVYSVHQHAGRIAVQPAAVVHGRGDGLAGAFATGVAGHGSRNAKNDALHAADVSGVLLQLCVGHGALHDGQHAAWNSADAVDENEPISGGKHDSGIDAAAEKEKMTAHVF